MGPDDRRELEGRLGDSQETADAVVWLCSEDASYVMGQPIVIDGGLLAQ
ncbi:MULTISPECIES: SDR family oxidoreductase [Haloferacaceae]|uniref:SDR family oxidoreductase n=1 Tax=Halorubrum glutamatedens TaxID=2707018 RepID=A0ABD5QWL8_9EURY|nr:SDR family oxidoreductase [Halobellus captivus]